MQRREGCHNLDPGRKRDFIIAPYLANALGVLEAAVPASAPCGPGCRVVEHGFRERATGPRHPLLVVRCSVHKRSFTVYPIGFIPYSRRRVVPREEPWSQTVFDAALEAGAGKRWSDFRAGILWWPTQWRRIGRAAELLGLCADGRTAERMAHELDVDLHVHAAAREAYGGGGFRQRGRAVEQVLDAVREAVRKKARLLRVDVQRELRLLLQRLLRAGSTAGFCGLGYWADPRSGLRPVTAF
jgi:hypothetical protein